MKKLPLITIGCLLLTGCSTLDGRSPNVGVGVSVGGSAPPPVVRNGGGPPPWAPAHGRRAKEARYRYYYYPASGVYLNVGTGSYFYMNGGTWQVGMTLPSAISVDAAQYVALEMETDRPYLYFEEHKNKYKSPGRSKGRGHGKGHHKDND